MFLNIEIDLIILKTYDQQFTLTTKKSLHITFKIRLFLTKLQTKTIWHLFVAHGVLVSILLRPQGRWCCRWWAWPAGRWYWQAHRLANVRCWAVEMRVFTHARVHDNT